VDDTLIIFDCDGVLVNSEPLAARVLAEAIRSLGVAMENDEAARVFLGCSMEMVIDIVAARLGRPVETGFTQSFLDQLHMEMQRDLAAIAGVHEAIEQILLNGNVGGLCVASNGEPETVALSLEAVGLISFFKGRLYTASAAGRPKPYPDLFLHAAHDMNYAPANCIVIEDSLHGVNAALAAGMRIFQYAPYAEAVEVRDHTNSVAEARIFINMNQLPSLIAAELQR
jgi:phosphoglycolate phosphatase